MCHNLTVMTQICFIFFLLLCRCTQAAEALSTVAVDEQKETEKKLNSVKVVACDDQGPFIWEKVEQDTYNQCMDGSPDVCIAVPNKTISQGVRRYTQTDFCMVDYINACLRDGMMNEMSEQLITSMEELCDREKVPATSASVISLD